MNFDPNKLSVTFCNLVNIVYGKKSHITMAPDAKSKKRSTMPIPHNVVRMFKGETDQTRYPLTVIACLLWYDGQLILMRRHPDILVNDITSLPGIAWKVFQERTLDEFKIAMDAKFAGDRFDGEHILKGAMMKIHQVTPTIGITLRETYKLVSLYKAFRTSYNAGSDTYEERFQHLSKFANSRASIEYSNRSIAASRSGMLDHLEEGNFQAIDEDFNEGMVTLGYVDSFASTVCAEFGFEHIALFDMLSIVDTLQTVDLRSIDSIVKHNFYTQTSVLTVLERLMQIADKTTTLPQFNIIRRQVATLLHSGYAVVSQNKAFIEQISRILQPGKKVEDVHMIDYDMQYRLSSITY